MVAGSCPGDVRGGCHESSTPPKKELGMKWEKNEKHI